MARKSQHESLEQILAQDNLCISSNPKGTDKGWRKSYVKYFYEIYFDRFKLKPIRLLEIGFRHGASLALWSKYFQNGFILGVDNLSDISLTAEQSVNQDWVNRPNVKTVYGDAYSDHFAAQIDGLFDIIIDDGPHSLKSQQRALELYLTRLNVGGLFVVEDTLSGGMVILPLLMKVPISKTAYFYDFRWHNQSRDNCLFVVENKRKPLFICLLNRLSMILLGIAYFLLEYPIYVVVKAFKK